MLTPSRTYDVIVIGGGPAGSGLARLLARWGHRILLLARPVDPSRGLAESVPPSTRKLLAAMDALEMVEQAAFAPNRGNLVFWGGAEPRAEGFGEDQTGWLLFRPDLDRLALAGAAKAGADVRIGGIAVDVRVADDHRQTVEYEMDGTRHRATARFVADCSGRAGLLARRGLRVPERSHTLQAYLGTWTSAIGWPAEVGRTIVETYEDGWAWGMAAAPGTRQIAVMVDGATTRTTRGPTIGHAYAAELAKTRHVRAMVEGASLGPVWACDGSMYSARQFAGPGFVLVGDAGTCIDPLSSSGLKKALGSAWLAAIALHTSLVDPDRRDVALDFFGRREREVYEVELARTREYARLAFDHHGGRFWAARAGGADVPAPIDAEAALLRGAAIAAAHERLRHAPFVTLSPGRNLRLAKRAVVRGREIVLEDALQLGPDTLRFAAGVDLPAVVTAAAHRCSVLGAYDAYCGAAGQVPLPHFVTAVSLLLSAGALEMRVAGVA